jgi:hypothetical protein
MIGDRDVVARDGSPSHFCARTRSNQSARFGYYRRLPMILYETSNQVEGEIQV